MPLRSLRPVLLLALLLLSPWLSACRAAATPAPTPTGEPGPPALSAGFLVVDGVYGTELVAPWDVLEHAGHHVGGQPGIEVFTVSPDGAPVTTAEGLELVPDHGFADAPPIDILVVPSAAGSRDRDLENRELVAWVERVGSGARHVMSLCWGAFVLGEAGLLDGRASTTFPSDYERLAARFPATDVKVNVSFVHDGKLLTSQGGVRSFDVAIYLVAFLYGDDVARRVGEGLLIPWPPREDRPMYISDAAAMMSRPAR